MTDQQGPTRPLSSGDPAPGQHADSEVADVRLTLNEAVDLLNCSTEFTLGLIARGEIDLTRVSVLAYRERDDQQRREAADEVTRLGQEIEADDLDAVLRAARDDLHAQTAAPYHQERKAVFLRRLEAGDIPAGDNAEHCPTCAPLNLPYPWICKGHPEAYTRAMDIARGEPAVGTASIPDGGYVEVYTEAGWIRADPVKLAADLAQAINERDDARREIAKLHNRDRTSTWKRQANELARQAVTLGDYEATLARVKALAERWRYVPGKHDAARQLLAALGIKETR